MLTARANSIFRLLKPRISSFKAAQAAGGDAIRNDLESGPYRNDSKGETITTVTTLALFRKIGPLASTQTHLEWR